MVPDDYRRSPIQLERPVLRKELRHGWEIVTQYEDEGDPPWLIDLSHAQKFDYPHPPLSDGPLPDISMPEKTGAINIRGGFLSLRLNQQQSLVLNLTQSPVTLIERRWTTDLTDAFALLAMIGHSVFEILEVVTSLDLFPPGKNPPFALQGPVLRTRSLLFLLRSDQETPAILLAVPRGFGQSFSTALLQAGEPWNLSPAGEAAFSRFFERLAF